MLYIHSNWIHTISEEYNPRAHNCYTLHSHTWHVYKYNIHYKWTTPTFQHNSEHVEGSSVNYELHVSGYTGMAGDSFTAIVNLNGMQFTTRDHGNDQWSSGHCSQHWEANGWWFNNCFRCNLNGPYLCGPVQRGWVGVIWETFRGGSQSLKYTEMKMYWIYIYIYMYT